MTGRGPLDRFPFRRHRTLADVARTADLLAAATFRRLRCREAREMHRLLVKARKHNPPLAHEQEPAA